MSKPLYECDPRELSEADLSDLYNGLVAKLAIVTDELIGRREGGVVDSINQLAAESSEGLQRNQRQRLMQNLQRQQANVSRLRRFQTLISQELKTLMTKIERDRESDRAKISIAAQL
jgi:hypothetical protein